MPSLEAADVESDTFDPYNARGGRAARRLPTPTRHMQRTARRPAPARVSLLSRSLPEGRSSALASAFAAPEEQVNFLGVGCAYPVRLQDMQCFQAVLPDASAMVLAVKIGP